MTETDHPSQTGDQTTPGGGARLWVDTHVHLHPRFDEAVFLDAAADHFAAAGAGLGVLCMTEVSGVSAFTRLRDAGRAGRWGLTPEGAFGLKALRDDGARVGLIAGRQVRCDNGLEVLAVGRRVEVADGLSLAASLAAVQSSGALAVLPYGVGKWSGARGRAVRSLIEDGPADVAFGDNAGRVGPGEQALLRRARRCGRTVLVGTDPLPLASGERRAGSWGVVVDAAAGDDSGPEWSERVTAALAQAGPSPVTFGRRLGLVSAVAQQVGVRLP